MSAGKARLTTAAIVFVAWLSFLGWLAWTAGKHPWTADQNKWTIVSRPQFLVASLYVVADLQAGTVKPPSLKVKLPSVVAVPQPGWLTSLPLGGLLQTAPESKVLPPTIELPPVVEGHGPFEGIKVKEVLWSKGKANLEDATLFVQNLRLSEEKYGWEGPGTYILALTKSQGKGGLEYRVTAVPRSPGYEPPPANDKVRMTPGPIYRLTPAIRRQVEQIIQMYHRP